jgi:hypothetical protein
VDLENGDRECLEVVRPKSNSYAWNIRFAFYAYVKPKSGA